MKGKDLLRKHWILKTKPARNQRKIKKIEFPKKGGVMTHIEGMKYPLRGLPRDFVVKLLDPVKGLIEAQITHLHRKIKPYLIPTKRYSDPVREIHRAFSELIKAEKLKGMKHRWEAIRDLTCLLLEEDTSYRWRLQWIAERMNMEKLKLSKEDKYYFRMKTAFKHGSGREKKDKSN